MVMDPTTAAEAAVKALGVAPSDSKGGDLRFKQGQLTYSATMAAVESRCDCEACQLLREAAAVLRVKPGGGRPDHGPDHSPTP